MFNVNWKIFKPFPVIHQISLCPVWYIPCFKNSILNRNVLWSYVGVEAEKDVVSLKIYTTLPLCFKPRKINIIKKQFSKRSLISKYFVFNNCCIQLLKNINKGTICNIYVHIWNINIFIFVHYLQHSGGRDGVIWQSLVINVCKFYRNTIKHWVFQIHVKMHFIMIKTEKTANPWGGGGGSKAVLSVVNGVAV